MFGFGKKKKSDEVHDIDPELFSSLRAAVRDVLSSKFSSGKIPDPEHGLYLLGVFVQFDFDSSHVCLYYITEEKYQSRMKSKKPEQAHYYRWSMVEYGSESICEEELGAIWKAYAVEDLDEEIHEIAIDDFEGRTQFAVIQALSDVKKTRLIETPTSRDKLTLLAGGMNNEERPDDISLIIGVRALNSEPVSNQFTIDWMKLKGIKGAPAEWISGLSTLINGRRTQANKTTLGRLVSKK